MTTSVIQYRLVAADSAVTQDREVTVMAIDHTITTAEDTANSAAITIPNLGTVRSVLSVQVRNTSNVHRAPQGAVTLATNVVTVADTGFAVNEVVKLIVVGYAA